MRKIYFAVILAACVFIFVPNSALAADSYDGAGTVVIDTNPAINLQASVEAALLLEGSGHNASHVTHLTITDDVTYTLTSTDLLYIAGFLSNMTHLDVASSVSVDFNGDSILGDVGDGFFMSNNTIVSVKFPGVTFGNFCFNECPLLESIHLPLATDAGDLFLANPPSMFHSQLVDVNLPLLARFGNSAFWYCENLETINLPSAVEFDYGAFFDCFKLESVTLPNATTFADYAFGSCIELDALSLPSTTSIGLDSFYACTQLDSLHLPKVTSIGGNIFQACPQPIEMTFGSAVPNLSAVNQFGNLPLAAGSVLNVPDTAYNLYDNDPADTAGSTNDNLWFTWPLNAIASPPAKNPSTGDCDSDSNIGDCKVHIAEYMYLQ